MFRRWQGYPSVGGPPQQSYNRFRRWTMRAIWRWLFEALAHADPEDGQAVNSKTRPPDSMASSLDTTGNSMFTVAKRRGPGLPRLTRIFS
jgi:hypothetical protein